MSLKLKEVIDMKEKSDKKKGKKNPYKIVLFVLLGVVVLVGLYLAVSELQNNAFAQGVQQGAVSAESNVVQQINNNQEIPIIVGEQGNQSVQWVGMGQVCAAMLQQQQQQTAPQQTTSQQTQPTQ